MDLELLSKMVTELIIDHDVVGLPCMGSFVATEVPAAFSDKGYTINPPYRKLSFRDSISDDGLLYSLYASSNGIDIQESKSYIDAFFTELCEVLKTRKSISLPSLGRLRSTEENKFFFVADEDLDIYPDGFGLESVSLKTHGLPDEMVVISPPHVVRAGESTPVDGMAEDGSEASELDVTEAADESALTEESASPDKEEKQPEEEREVAAPHKERHSGIWITLLVVALTALFLLGLFLVLSRLTPDFIDTLLYTPEELKIINN